MEPTTNNPRAVGQELQQQLDAETPTPTTDAPTNVAGEALLAVMSFASVLGNKPIVLHKYHIEKAKGLPKTIKRAVRDFLLDKAKDVEEEKHTEFDLKEALEALRQTPEQLNLINRLDFEVGDEFLTPLLSAFATAWKFLQETAPERSKMTVLGPKALQPNALELARFRQAWRLVEDPRLVLKELAKGRVPRRYVDTFSKAYPSLYQHLRAAVIEAVIELKGQRPGWQPTYNQDRALQALLQTSTLNARLIQDIQKIHQEAAQPKQPSRSSSTASPSSSLQTNATPAQRLAAK